MKKQMKKQRTLKRELGFSITESSEFELIKFDGSFYCDPVKTESNYNKLFNEVNLLKKMASDLGIVVLKVKGMVNLNPLLKSYNPDYLSSEVVLSSTKSKKLKEQRIENGGIDKVKDQFRYLTLLSMDWADTNVFPIASRYGTSDNVLEHYDRSNLMEFLHRNLMREQYTSLSNSNLTQQNIEEMNTIDENEISSKDVLEIINDIETKYPDTTSNSLEFSEIKERLENSDASEKFTISKLLGESGVDDLLNGSTHHFTIVIGKSDIVVNELKNINNKFNEWHNINFVFADLIDVKPLTQYVKDNLMSDEWDEILKYQNKLIGKAEEYRILPILAPAIFKKSDFTKNTISVRHNFASLAWFLEGTDKTTKGGNYGISAIPDLVKETTKLSKAMVKHLYSPEVKAELDKLKVRLKYLAEFADKNEYDVAKITELAHPTFGIPLYPLYAAILVDDNKMFNKWDDDGCTLNAKRLIQIFNEVFFGDDVFKIEKKSKKAIISPKGEFAEMISLKNDTTNSTDQRGSKSHLGRAHHFTDIELINKFVEKFNKITGNQGSNIKATKKEIKTFQEEYAIESLEWFEMDSHGRAQIVGWDIEGDPLTGTSLEHLDNTSHHQLVLRYLGNNQNEGASDKSITTESQWYEWQAELQESKFTNKYKNKLALQNTINSLKFIAEQKRECGK
jgi:hypothetical protein